MSGLSICMPYEDITITNYKFHSKVDATYLSVYLAYLKSDNTTIRKRKNSFVIIRIGKFVYTCFYTGYINVTGVKSDLFYPLQRLAFEIGLPESAFSAPSIDNIHTKRHFSSHINLNNLKYKLDYQWKFDKIIHIHFNRERFPGLFIKTSLGTILWFATDTIITLGSKTHENIEQLYGLIKNIREKWSAAAT